MAMIYSLSTCIFLQKFLYVVTFNEKHELYNNDDEALFLSAFQV
jgi:hypothetical protein